MRENVHITNQRTGAQPRERGVALLVVLTMMVMFTAFVADFAYDSRVRYTLASHARDEIKARIMAETGIKQFQMLLEFERQILASLGNQAATLLPMIGFAPNQSIIVQLTRSMPLPCNSLAMLSGSGGPGSSGDEAAGEGGEAAADPLMMLLSAGSGEEQCSVKGEVQANQLYSLKGLRTNIMGINHPKVVRLVELFRSEEFSDELRRLNLTPEELAGNIADWADLDSMRYANNGYEDNLYNRGPEAYLPKNNDFDSVAELRLVAGMTDELYRRLARRVTIHEDRFILPITEPQTLADATFYLTGGRYPKNEAERLDLWNRYQQSYVSAVPPLPPTNRQQLEAVLSSVPGIAGNLDPSKLDALFGTGATGTANRPGAGRNQTNTMPTVFTLTARAQVGDVVKTIRAVVDMSATPPQYQYWRED